VAAALKTAAIRGGLVKRKAGEIFKTSQLRPAQTSSEREEETQQRTKIYSEYSVLCTHYVVVFTSYISQHDTGASNTIVSGYP
jgi:hypothetical protein